MATANNGKSKFDLVNTNPNNRSNSFQSYPNSRKTQFPKGNTNSNPTENNIVEVSYENAIAAIPINEIISKLHNQLTSVVPFNLLKAFDGLISQEEGLGYLPFPVQMKKMIKETNEQHRSLMTLFSSCPSGIIFYFIRAYLSIFNGRITDNPFYQILSSIVKDGILERQVDELKYTAYKHVFPIVNYNEEFGNEQLRAELLKFFRKPYRREPSIDKNLFFGFIKCSPKTSGFMKLLTGLTKKFTNVGGHMNSFIIDKQKGLIIHFEPKGKGVSTYQPFELERFIRNIAGLGLDEELIIEGIKYKVIDTKGMKMVQTGLLNFDIYCQTYSILAILIYMLNIERIRVLPPGEILAMFSSISQKHALVFRNFFYTVCKEDFNRINAEQMRHDLQYIAGDVVENFAGGSLRKTRKNKPKRKQNKFAAHKLNGKKQNTTRRRA
jgi:hypothetical protein